MQLVDRILAWWRRLITGETPPPKTDLQVANHETLSSAETRGRVSPDDERYDRQLRAFGRSGQHQLARLTVGVIGAGGAGSVVIETLAHLGVGGLIIVDPDHLEATNLNRVVGATSDDVLQGATKVAVAARTATRINPNIQIATFAGSVLDPEVWAALRAADVLIGAVDGHAPRWALNYLAVQYARLYLDVGVEITRGDDTLEVGGHVAVVRPDGPCLRCLNGYDPALAADELQPLLAQAKRASGYLADEPDEPAPSVLFLNQAVAAQVTAEVLNWVAPWRPPQTYLLVDLTTPSSTSIGADPDPDCPVCGQEGVRGLGDLGGIPVGDTYSTESPPPAPIASNRHLEKPGRDSMEEPTTLDEHMFDPVGSSPTAREAKD